MPHFPRSLWSPQDRNKTKSTPFPHCGKEVLLISDLCLRGEPLLRHPDVHKVNVSLHVFEANDLDMPLGEYREGGDVLLHIVQENSVES